MISPDSRLLVSQWSLGQPYTEDLRYLLQMSRQPVSVIQLPETLAADSILERAARWDSAQPDTRAPQLLVPDWRWLAEKNFDLATAALEGVLAKRPFALIVARDLFPPDAISSVEVGDAFFDALSVRHGKLLTPPSVLKVWHDLVRTHQGQCALKRLQGLWDDLVAMSPSDTLLPRVSALWATARDRWTSARCEAMEVGLTKDDITTWSVEEASADYLYLQWAGYADVLRALDRPSGAVGGVLTRLSQADKTGQLLFTRAWQDVRHPSDCLDAEMLEEWPLAPEDPLAEALRGKRLATLLQPVFADDRTVAQPDTDDSSEATW